MKGGEKQFWLRVHHREIEQFYYEHGPDATMREYNMRPPTLERFLNRKSTYLRMRKA